MNTISPDPPLERELLSRMKENLVDEKVLNALLSSIFITDLEGHILFWNHFLDIWLIQDPVKIGATLDAVFETSRNPPLFEPAEFLAATLHEISRSGETSGSLSLVNGAQTRYHIKKIPTNRLVWTFTDTSALKRTEEFAQFYLDLMGHDIRNHLQEILLSVELLASNPKESDFRKILSHMTASVAKCGNLIRKVKATEGLDLIDLEEFPLSEIVADVVENVSGRFPDVDVEFQILVSSCGVRADKHLSILVENIIENGIIHNSSNPKQVWVRIDEAPWGYELSVSDNGSGIADRTKRDVFDKHRRYGGVGLHLASMIIEKYGGHISIHDCLQDLAASGAMVKIWFPAKELQDFGVRL